MEAAQIDAEDVLRVAVHTVRNDLLGLGSLVEGLARDLDVRISRFAPEDESLESVFRYLVGGR